MIIPKELQTSRLLLRPISVKYRQEIFREFTADITVYMNPQPAKEIAETDSFIKNSAKNMENGKEIVMAVLLKDTEEFLGCAGLHEIQTKTPELGIWIKKSAHGNKYGREAVTALKHWADENLDYTYIIYPADKQNVSSRKIAESLGGTVAREMKNINASGNELDEVEYHIYKLTK